MKTMKRVSRKYFYSIMSNINFIDDIEEIEHTYKSGIFYCKPLNLHFKMVSISGVINNNPGHNFSKIYGPEDTMFFIEKN